MKYVSFNINHYVRVQLTEQGKAELKRQAEKTRKQFPEIKHEHSLPKEDKEGWSKWQLWCLMQDLGGVMGCGFNTPFKTEIQIEIKD